jgi:carboxypeptidase Q
VRVVLWTNEENGGRGGLVYLDAHRSELRRHVLMLESDTGVFQPTGFGFTGNDAARNVVKTVATLLHGIGADEVGLNGGGSDIDPSVREGGIPSLSTEIGGDYFIIHHTPADTVDKIDPIDMAKCAAAVAVMTYVIADLPRGLGE